ncbi:MAG: hypothetical protein AAFN77_05365 [Planctomycetota bacterium]
MNGTTEYRPSRRRLRVFAFDPGLGLQFETAELNEMTLDVIWEVDRVTGESLLKSGPIGDYLEVVDCDPASECFYPPVDLNDPYLLAEDGLPPTEGNPQFHQQMVYAVAMKTIEHFELALGRVAMWAPRWIRDRQGRVTSEEFVRKLRIYPHALREANAYYSPKKKALLFGYFPSRAAANQLPGGLVFTCLSHDVIAHETTHALLDGLHPRFCEATNQDVHALHEAFSDIVALFQRFAHPEILEHQISLTRGDLEKQNLLGQLAQQFGRSLGKRGALRDAIGFVDPEDGQWKRHQPDPELLGATTEPHARGAILVAAVFDAFLTIYRSRSADLFRIASNGTGVLPEGDIHPDLVRRLAREAARAAEGVLRMCIRALDYVPPVDINFGDYLRGIITADLDIHPEDKFNYRIAFVDAFRKWGIYPDGVRSLSISSLCHPRLDIPTGVISSKANYGMASNKSKAQIRSMQQVTSELFQGLSQKTIVAAKKAKVQINKSLHDYASDEVDQDDYVRIEWDLGGDRETIWESTRKNAKIFHRWLTNSSIRKMLSDFGLTINPKAPPSVYRTTDGQTPAVEIHSVRCAQRRGPRGEIRTDLVVEVCQRRRGYFDAEKQKKVDKSGAAVSRRETSDFRFRRGCTLIIDSTTHKIRYAIANRGSVLDNTELERVRKYLTGEESEPVNAFYASHGSAHGHEEHFAVLHRR